MTLFLTLRVQRLNLLKSDLTMKDDFYIGWQDDAPAGYNKFISLFLAILILLILIGSGIWVSKGSGFADSRFEYGTQTEFEGVIYEYPAPMLVVQVGEEGMKSIPLVNFGKFGVVKPMEFFKSQMRNNLKGYKVKLRGTIIEFDNKQWLELTDEEKSLLSFEKLSEPSPERRLTELGESEVHGEIVDPKCFFGVMKPGFGKVHLSCAIRCISGGVPPILVSPQQDDTRNYYFVTNSAGKPLNDHLISYVGLPITVKGLIKTVDDWEVIEIGVESISLSTSLLGPSIFTPCLDEPKIAGLSPNEF